MDIEKIREFLVITECKDLLEAGDRLYTSPSTLSRHIKALETELGKSLFARTPRNLILNENGAFFLPYAKQIVKAYEDYLTAAEKQTKNHKIRLHLGITPTIAQFDIEPILSRFQKTDGPIRLNIETESQENLLEALRNHKFDFVFLRSHGRPDTKFPCICCRRDSMVAVMPEDHPLAGRKELNLKELQNENLLLLRENKYTVPNFTETCMKMGFEPRITLTSYLEENLVDFVRRGIGIALLNGQHMQSIRQDALTIVELVPKITSEIYVLFCAEITTKKIEKTFLEHLKSLEND